MKVYLGKPRTSSYQNGILETYSYIKSNEKNFNQKKM